MTRPITISAAAILTLTGAATARVIIDPPPANVIEGAVEGNSNAKIFLESTQFLAADLALEHAATGLVDESADVVPGLVPAFHTIESYLIHWDPIGTATNSKNASATFNSDILGVYYSETELTNTQPMLGAPGTTYPALPGDTGFDTEIDNGDTFEISADRRTISISFSAGANVDHIRVITAPSGDLAHEYNFEGNAWDCVSGADATEGSNVLYRSSDDGVPFALGQAYRMGANSGAGGVLSVPNAQVIQLGLDDFSIAFSIRRVQADTSNIDFVLDAADTDGWDLILPSGSSVRFRAWESNGVAATVDSGSLVFGSDTDEWHHVAFVCDRSETDGARWYFDGQLVSADDATALGALVSDRDLLIGGSSDSNQSLDAFLGRLRVYAFALTDDQVKDIAREGGFFSPPPGPCPGDLDGNGFTDVLDFSIFAQDFGCGN